MGRARTMKRLQQRMAVKVYETLAHQPPPPSKTYAQDSGEPYTHTEAPSLAWEPMVFKRTVDMPSNVSGQLGERLEEWENKYYTVSVRRYAQGFPIGNSQYVILGITHVSETAHRDFRDFQRVKNDICGDEWEGVELYPSESRLVDPSNRSFLWCVPPGTITWGLDVPGRRVLTMKESIAPQRPFWNE